jgi:hypothetical protein
VSILVSKGMAIFEKNAKRALFITEGKFALEHKETGCQGNRGGPWILW